MCIIQMIVPKLLSSFFSFFSFWPLRLACRISDLDQWLNPGPTMGRVLRPNHSTARELPTILLFAWPRKTFSVVKRRPDFVLGFQGALHLGSKGVVWTCLKPLLRQTAEGRRMSDGNSWKELAAPFARNVSENWSTVPLWAWFFPTHLKGETTVAFHGGQESGLE